MSLACVGSNRPSPIVYSLDPPYPELWSSSNLNDHETAPSSDSIPEVHRQFHPKVPLSTCQTYFRCNHHYCLFTRNGLLAISCRNSSNSAIMLIYPNCDPNTGVSNGGTGSAAGCSVRAILSPAHASEARCMCRIDSSDIFGISESETRQSEGEGGEGGVNGRTSRIASVSWDGKVMIWDCSAYKCVETFSVRKRSESIAFCKWWMGGTLWVGQETNPYELVVLSAETGQNLLRLQGHKSYISCVEAIDAPNRCVASISSGRVFLWDVRVHETKAVAAMAARENPIVDLDSDFTRVEPKEQFMCVRGTRTHDIVLTTKTKAFVYDMRALARPARVSAPAEWSRRHGTHGMIEPVGDDTFALCFDVRKVSLWKHTDGKIVGEFDCGQEASKVRGMALLANLDQMAGTSHDRLAEEERIRFALEYLQRELPWSLVRISYAGELIIWKAFYKN